MTSHSPHVSSWPVGREEDDGLELLGAPGSRAAHQVSDAPPPSARPAAEGEGPSIVIAPQAEVPVPPSGTRKRVAEPTLVIRDRRRVEELRAGVQRMARAKARRRVGTILLWGGASALAFGFGAVIAFFAASSGNSQAAMLEAVAPALPALGSDSVVEKEAEAPTAQASGKARVPSNAQASSPSPAVAAQEAPAESARPAPPEAAADSAPAEPAPAERAPAERAPAERALEPKASVVSLADLPDAAAPPAVRSASVPEVVSLDDL